MSRALYITLDCHDYELDLVTLRDRVSLLDIFRAVGRLEMDDRVREILKAIGGVPMGDDLVFVGTMEVGFPNDLFVTVKLVETVIQ